MSVPPTTHHIYSQARESDATLHESTQYSIIQQPDVYHPQNDGYTRGRTYITETDLKHVSVDHQL